MSVKLHVLTEHRFEFLCTGVVESTHVKNATLLEITYHGSVLFPSNINFLNVAKL